MPRSRLPSPPSTNRGPGKTRPLPPEPTSTEAPPPLPARPPGPGSSRGIPPPPSRPHPTQDSSSDESEPGTYEDADAAPPPPPPSSIHKPPINTQQSFGGEIYDDLDEVIEVNGQVEETYEPPGEMYNDCDIKTAMSQPVTNTGLIQEDLYEEPPPPEEEEEESIQDAEYEFVPENVSSPPPPRQRVPPPPTIAQPSLPVRPPPSQMAQEEELIQDTEYEFVPANTAPSPPASRHPIPPPPSVGMPSLPARPGQQSRKGSDAGHDSVPDLPKRPGAPSGGGKKPASGNMPGIGISLGDLSNIKARLKKVSSEEKKDSEVPDTTPAPQEKPNTDSFQGRMNLFKQAEEPVTNKQKPESPPLPSPPPPPQPVQELEEDDIYDVGYSEKEPPDPLAQFGWYHRDIERQLSENKLNTISQDGSFLVRKSVRGGDTQPYTLVVLYRSHVYNLKIRKRPDTKVALGEEKPDELAFVDVPALITYHRNNDVVLVNKKEGKQYKTLLAKFPNYG